ncbi:MAG TPA: 5-deoxy-glucuronate isomerase [Vicinamibacterales bacterium]|jgi:5-deoxy-glucuronate isomerase|nr:5-deoxy-glucuronate isomerase [Vicinamibacterales bacterium]
MLNDTLYRIRRIDGLQQLQKRGEGGARELTTSRLRLAAGAAHKYQIADEETVLVLQEGRGRFVTPEGTWTLSRKNVFDERASALYLPPGVPLTVTSEAPLEAVLFSTPAPGGGHPSAIGPEKVEVNARGKENYSREVHNVFVTDPHVKRLMVGETFNPPGNWSSYPPHKHDGRDGEPVLEEVYYYRVAPQQGFGQQILYTSDGECVTHTVRDGDAVLLPYGYHPVSAPPGYRLYYLWGMAGAERKLALHEDPAHKWIHSA